MNVDHEKVLTAGSSEDETNGDVTPQGDDTPEDDVNTPEGDTKGDDTFPVVGIGASAGGLEAFLVVGRYAPVGVLVNDRLDVVQFRGRTSAYLEPPSGEANFSLLNMAREGLFGDLRGGIAEARERNETVERTGVRVRSDGEVRTVDLKFTPLHLPRSTEFCFLILFEESETGKGHETPNPPNSTHARSSG